MTDPLERLTNLLALLLETRVPLTLERISLELEGQYPDDLTAKRGAFERDKALLRDEGVPIAQVILGDGSTGYSIDRASYELGDLGLSDDERQALQLASATVRSGVEWADDALLKLDAGSRAVVDADIIASLPSLSALSTLFDAHLERARVSFRYLKKDRNVDPYGLLSREGFWYVVGFEYGAQGVRTFRVDRIEGDITRGESDTYTVPAGFDPAAVVSDTRRPSGTTTARVAIDAVIAAKVEADLGTQTVAERHPGGIVVDVPYGPGFRSWVLGLMEHAEVLSPAEVRSELVEWLRSMEAS